MTKFFYINAKIPLTFFKRSDARPSQPVGVELLEENGGGESRGHDVPPLRTQQEGEAAAVGGSPPACAAREHGEETTGQISRGQQEVIPVLSS